MTESLPASYTRAINLSGAQAQVFVEAAGLYRFSAHVLDETGRRSSQRSIEITARECGGRPLHIDEITADPANPQSGQNVRLTAAVSDPDVACGDDLSSTATLSWRLLSQPQGSDVSLSESQTPSFRPEAAGEYRVQVSALSADGLLSAPLERSIEVSGCGGFPPSISSLEASAESVRVGEIISLTVRSDDPDREAPCALNDQHEAHWRLVSIPAGSTLTLNRQATDEISIIPDLEGVYEIEVIVTDQSGRTDRARQSISVSSCGRERPSLSTLSASPSSALLGDIITLSGEATPPDESCERDAALSWRWRILSRPNLSRARLSSTSSERPNFTPDAIGDYLFEAVVESANGRVSEALNVALTVRDVARSRHRSPISSRPRSLKRA